MPSIRNAFAPLAMFIVLASGSPLWAQDYDGMSITELETALPSAHPAAFYVLAARLYDGDRKDEAVFWLYAGQLRYRTHLACSPEGEYEADAALFSALSELIGSEINRYAFSDIEHLTLTIDSVVEWDHKTPNLFIENRGCEGAHDDILSGLGQLRDHLATSSQHAASNAGA